MSASGPLVCLVIRSSTGGPYQYFGKNLYLIGPNPIQIHYFEYPKRLTNRINDVHDFSIKYSDIFEKKPTLTLFIFCRYFIERIINFIYNRLFCCSPTGMVSVTPTSRYVTSALRYQSRSSMFIRGLIPRYSTELSDAVLINHIWLQLNCHRF